MLDNLVKITNDFGNLQWVDEEDNPTCPRCGCLVLVNQGQGSICSTCQMQDFIESELDYND